MHPFQSATDQPNTHQPRAAGLVSGQPSDFPATKRVRHSLEQRERLFALACILPALLLICILIVYPVIYTGGASNNHWRERRAAAQPRVQGSQCGPRRCHVSLPRADSRRDPEVRSTNFSFSRRPIAMAASSRSARAPRADLRQYLPYLSLVSEKKSMISCSGTVPTGPCASFQIQHLEIDHGVIAAAGWLRKRPDQNMAS
jgi:hypothetical protein